MNMALIAGGAQLLGGLLGGGRRDKRAMRQLAEIQRAADDAVEAYRSDQDRVKALRAEDEARLAAATGYDLEKLRDDARAAGFNPLTVLGATGGAGYDGRGAVLQTPFISMGDAMRIRVDARLGAAPLAVENAGYVGDAIAGAGAAFTSTALSQAQMLADKEIQKAMATMGAGPRAEMRAAVKSPFDVAALAVDDTVEYYEKIAGWKLDPELPIAEGYSFNKDGTVPVLPMNGGPPIPITKELAKYYGLAPGSYVPPGLIQDEAHEAVNAGASVWTALDSWIGLRRLEGPISATGDAAMNVGRGVRSALLDPVGAWGAVDKAFNEFFKWNPKPFELRSNQ